MGGLLRNFDGRAKRLSVSTCFFLLPSTISVTVHAIGFDDCHRAYEKVAKPGKDFPAIVAKHLDRHKHRLAELLQQSFQRMLFEGPPISGNEMIDIAEDVSDAVRNELNEIGKPNPLAAAGDLLTLTEASAEALSEILDMSLDTAFDRDRWFDRVTDEKVRHLDWLAAHAQARQFHEHMALRYSANGYTLVWDSFEAALADLIESELNSSALPYRTEALVRQIRNAEPSEGPLLIHPAPDRSGTRKICDVLRKDPRYQGRPRVIIDAYYGDDIGSRELVLQATDVVAWPTNSAVALPFNPHPHADKVTLMGLELGGLQMGDILMSYLTPLWFGDGLTEKEVQIDVRTNFFPSHLFPRTAKKLGIVEDTPYEQRTLDRVLGLPRAEAERTFYNLIRKSLEIPTFGEKRHTEFTFLALRAPRDGNFFPRKYIFKEPGSGRVIRIVLQ